MPRVSVVMPAFNAERYLRLALDSVLSQDYADFDVIVVNDGSTDGTAAILAEYAERDSRLRVMTQANGGAAAANNLAINSTDAEFIARMDADDISLPGRLTRLVRYLDEHPNAGAVGSGVFFIDHRGRQLAKQLNFSSPSRLTSDARSGKRNPLMNPSAMFRRQCWADAGGERPCFIRAHDFDLWVRMAAITEIHTIPTPLLQYRIHDESVSFKTVEWQGLCGLAARRSAELRHAGAVDPFDHLSSPITIDDLLAAGCSPQRCQEAILSGIAGQIVFSLLVSQTGRAEALLQLLEEKQRTINSRLEHYFFYSCGVRVALAKRQWPTAVNHAVQLLMNRSGCGFEMVRRLKRRCALS